MPDQSRHSLYRPGHATEALLGAFSFIESNAITVFVTAHEGDSDEVNRSVEHEIAHRSLALDSDTGAVQLALARAAADHPENPEWASWLSLSIESSWATYEGFAIEREAWIAALHGRAISDPIQPRYRDAAVQYQAVALALPLELRPWRFYVSRAVADFALNVSLRGVGAKELFTKEGMRDLLADRRRRPDVRLARISTQVERLGFSTATLRRAETAIERAFDELGSFAAHPMQALVESHLAPSAGRDAYKEALDAALMPIFFESFQELCPGLPFESTDADRRRFLGEAREDVGIPIPELVRASEATWPHRADAHSVQYVHEARFDGETWVRGADLPDELLEQVAAAPDMVACAVWGNGSTVCVLPFMDGPNTSPMYDPLRTTAAARRRPGGNDRVMRFSGERLFFVGSTSRTVAAFRHKLLGALYFDEESRELVSGPDWTSGGAVLRQEYSAIVALLSVMKAVGEARLNIVLKTPEVIFIAVRDRGGDPMLLEIPTALVGIIRANDAELFGWYREVTYDATQADDDLSSWGYLMASLVLAGALEPSLKGAEGTDFGGKSNTDGTGA